MFLDVIEGQYVETLERAELESILEKAVSELRWVDVAMVASELWRRDWVSFLNRDFLTTGEEPEHASALI